MKQKLTAEQKKFKLLEGSIVKQLILFALPLFFGNVLQQMFNTFDAVIAGRFIGPEAMTGIDEAGKVVNVLINIFMGVSVGAGIVVAQFFGAKNKENVSKAVHSAMIMGAVCGVLMMIIGLAFSDLLLKAVKIDADHFAVASEYLRIYFFGVAFVFIYNIGSGILRATGDSITPLIFLGISMCLDLVLNFVFVHPDILNMGVAGTIWSTVLTNALASVMVIIRLFFVKGDHRLSFKRMRVDRKILTKIAKVGFPVGLQNSVISIAHLVMLFYISRFGPAAEQGASLCNKIDGYLYVTMSALTMALPTFIGQNLGAGKKDRAKKAVKINILMCQGISLVMGTVLFFSHKSLMRLISPTVGDEALRIASMAMMVIIFSYPILALNDNFANALRASGQTLIPSAILITGMFGVRVGFMTVCLSLIGWNNVLAVFLTYPISWTFTCTCLAIVYFKGKWMDKKLTAPVIPPIEAPVFSATEIPLTLEQPLPAAEISSIAGEMPFKAEPSPVFNKES